MSAKMKDKAKDEERKPVPLKVAHLNLDDIPPELLPKHQERLKKQVRISVGNNVLCNNIHLTSYLYLFGFSFVRVI